MTEIYVVSYAYNGPHSVWSKQEDADEMVRRLELTGSSAGWERHTLDGDMPAVLGYWSAEININTGLVSTEKRYDFVGETPQMGKTEVVEWLSRRPIVTYAESRELVVKLAVDARWEQLQKEGKPYDGLTWQAAISLEDARYAKGAEIDEIRQQRKRHAKGTPERTALWQQERQLRRQLRRMEQGK